MNFRVLVFFIISTFLLASCGSKKRVVTTKKEQKERQVYQEQPKNSKNEPYEDTPAEIQDDVTKSLQKLIQSRVVSYYPVLDELGKGIVTQSEHTIMITSSGVEVLTA